MRFATRSLKRHDYFPTSRLLDTHLKLGECIGDLSIVAKFLRGRFREARVSIRLLIGWENRNATQVLKP